MYDIYTKNITLISIVDKRKIQSDSISLMGSQLFKFLIEEYQGESEIEIPEINGDILVIVVEYLEHLKFNSFSNIPKPIPFYEINEYLSQWEINFLSKYDIFTFLNLIKAANFLDIKPLFELVCAKTATIINNYDRDKFMEIFKIYFSSCL